MLLSINRYERKKNIALALDALAQVRTRLETKIFAKLRLVIAGGYDERLRDNRDTFRALLARAHDLGLTRQVVFLRSISTQERLALLAQCRAVVYTPEHEHFGYVPLEAMAAARPVVAVNSGGPQETIQHNETGLLCEPTSQAFAAALTRLILDRGEAQRLGRTGRAHVSRRFSLATFGHRLNQIVTNLTSPATTLMSD
jgi:alpha-1,3/alpha-1,6-mannosyltransferase